MFIKRLVLKNYKQHAELDKTFDGHINVIVGKNGKGKSNLMGAMQFALSGEQAGHKKDSLLQWGKDAGSVTMEFKHEDVDCSIKRSLHNGQATFKYGDDEYTGISKVAEALSVHLGWDKDIGKQAVFVRQAEIDNILFADARTRELSFQRLLGIHESMKVHKKLGELLSGWNLPVQYDEQIAEGKQRYEELKTRLHQLTTDLDKSKEQRKILGDIETLQTQLTGLSSSQTTLVTYKGLIDRITEYTVTLIPGHQAKLDGFDIPNVNIETLDQQIEQLRKLAADAQRYQEGLTRFRAAGEAVMQQGKNPVDSAALNTLERELSNVRESHGQLAGNLKLHHELLDVIERDTGAEVKECPLCGSTITDIASLKERLLNTITQLQSTLDNMDVDGKARQQADMSAKSVDWTMRRKSLLEAYQVAENELHQLPQTDGDPKVLLSQVDTMVQDRQRIVQTITDKANVEAQLKADQAQLVKMREEQVQLSATLNGLGITETELNTASGIDGMLTTIEGKVEKLKQQLSGIALIEQSVAEMTGMLGELQNTMDTLENTISTLEYKQAQQADRSTALDTLTRVRDWFHYANGPHLMSNNVLQDMTDDLNNFLGQFSAPFTVFPSDDVFGYKYIKHDGSPMPEEPPDAIHLSGGEKVQLAVSLRFANYCMFASKLGLLSLDEPTVYLDDDNVGRFCALMEQIKTVAQDMGLQIFIATHERSVIPFADNVIDLSPDVVV